MMPTTALTYSEMNCSFRAEICPSPIFSDSRVRRKQNTEIRSDALGLYISATCMKIFAGKV